MSEVFVDLIIYCDQISKSRAKTIMSEAFPEASFGKYKQSENNTQAHISKATISCSKGAVAHLSRRLSEVTQKIDQSKVHAGITECGAKRFSNASLTLIMKHKPV